MKQGSGDGKGSSGKSSSGRGRTTVRVKTAKRRAPSSARWLERQLNDPYVQKAKQDGWRCRAAYKLIEMDEKFHLLKPGMKIIDLGAAPGGWSQVAMKRSAAKIVGIDLLEIDPMPGVTFLQMDFMDPDAPDRLKAELGGEADLVMSDIAPNTIGHKATDHLRIMAMVEAGAEFAREVLKPGGAFVAKVFQGGTEAGLLAQLKREYAVVRHVKPPASRKDSAEQYLVATGFRGRVEV